MAFLACFIVGMVAYTTLPISLLPDIDIPQITVQISVQNTSARELENTVMNPIRQQLVQVTGVESIDCETHDGSAQVRLRFDYGTNIDLAFIEVNEKIDAAMSYLPKETERPRVIKASATDLPVFYLDLTLAQEKGNNLSAAEETGTTPEFLELSRFAESIVKRRIEQLPEVAMVDVTGVVEQQVRILPDPDRMASMQLSIENLESILTQNNVEPGSMTVRDGYYEYNIRFSSVLRTEKDIRDILFRQGERIVRLGDFCQVDIVPVKEKGFSLSNGKRAVTLAVIKQADENMDRLKRAVQEVMEDLKKQFPDIDFHISRNQTELLDYTISNLKSNLLLAFLFIFIVSIPFLADIRLPFIIGTSLLVSVVICFLFFFLFNVSLNIISLSGLVLALGMMIDNAIIVTENIQQYRERGYSIRRSCIRGTNEVITPMLSSSLTTVAVFLPLIFMSGIAGALFYNQAFSVTAGLFVSYLTGIILLPVLYALVYRTNIRRRGHLLKRIRLRNPIKEHPLYRFYDTGMDWVFGHKKVCLLFCLLSVPLTVVFFTGIRKERMPEIDQTELMVHVEWNENIHVDENRRRTEKLMAALKEESTEQAASVGEQEYLLDRDRQFSASEAELYFKTRKPEEVAPLQEKISRMLKREYPQAVVTFAPPETAFEKLFVTGEADIVAELYARNREKEVKAEELRELERKLEEHTGIAPTGTAFENQLDISIIRENTMLYNVTYDEIYRVLKTAFKENAVTVLHSYQQYLPITIMSEERTVNEVLRNTLVRSNPNQQGTSEYIPLQSLIRVQPTEDLKTLTAGRNGEYIPFRFYGIDDAETLMLRVKEVTNETQEWDTQFTGSFFSNRKMLNELMVILLVSVLLMYFILAAQFESFTQPLIVLFEIPIDVAFALLVLWVCGYTLNLMSAIGIIVTCGIIINDSILKLDAINELQKQDIPLLEAIHEAGRRRLRPIIMTSLTTIMAMVPLLFSYDMGSELQKPLAAAMIGAMSIGTLVSLFIIPLIYWFIYRTKHKQS